MFGDLWSLWLRARDVCTRAFIFDENRVLGHVLVQATTFIRIRNWWYHAVGRSALASFCDSLSAAASGEALP